MKYILPLILLSTFFLISCDEESTPDFYTLTINVTPENAGTIIPSSSLTLFENEELSILAQSTEGYVFTGWTGSVTSSENPLTVTITENLDLTANFLIKSYPLTISVSGRGQITETVIQQKTDYEHGTLVQLVAIADENWEFMGWSGDISGEDATIEVSVTEPLEVIALFEFQIQEPQPVAKTNDTKVYMHYMPWFTSAEMDGGWGYHWTMNNRNPDNIVDGQRDIASHYYPLIGPYSSKDPDLAEYHLLLMKYSGIDAVLIDWYGTYDVNDYQDNFEGSENLIDKLDDVGLTFGIVYEDRTTEAVVDAGLAGSLIEVATTDFTYMEENYFNSSSYVTVNGNPLALAWTPIVIESAASWAQILSVANPNLMYLALWYQGGDLGASGDGEYAWVYGGNGNHQQELINFYSNRVSRQTLWLGAAYPGFVDFYEEGGVGNVIGWEIPHNGTQTLDLTLSLAEQYNVDHLQLVTFNDFGEGTMFEPTVEFGYSFLTTIQEFTGVEYTQTELELIYNLYLLRKEHALDSDIQDQLNQVFSLLVSLQVDEATTLMNELQAN